MALVAAAGLLFSSNAINAVGYNRQPNKLSG